MLACLSHVNFVPARYLPLLFASVALMGGCGGGPSVSFVQQNSNLKVNENKEGTVWTAKATYSGNGYGMTYKILPGKDGDLFKIDPATGALSFRAPPDFETPLDIKQDNGYEVDIQVSAHVEDRGSEAPREPGYFVEVSDQQVVNIQVMDISNPVLTVIKPLQYQNVGDGNPVSVETSVKWVDTEDNRPIQGDGVLLNGVPMQQDTQDPLIWHARVDVPEGGATLSAVGYKGVTPKIRVLTQLFNKRGAISPSFLAVNPSKDLVVFDAVHDVVAKADLVSKQWVSYFKDPRLSDLATHLFDYNSSYQFAYVNIPFSRIGAIDISKSTPSIYYAGTVPNVVGLMADSTNQRLISITNTPVAGVNKYKLLAIPTAAATAFVNPKTEQENHNPAIYTTLWDIPDGVVQGTFKYFNYHRANKIYIFADERTVAGKVSTTIQGFGEDGSKRFEAVVGPDISNLAVNNKGTHVYVAENHATSAGKLKAIDINTGEARDLVQSYGESMVGAYSDIRMDNVNQRLFIGDDVSDSIFSVDLSTQVLSDLNITQKPLPEVIDNF